MENNQTSSKNQESTKFAAEIIGANLPEETKAQIAEEIQTTVLRHLAKIDRSVYAKPVGTTTIIDNPILWRGVIAILAAGIQDKKIGELDNTKVPSDIKISNFR
jgi:hypothetical protein